MMVQNLSLLYASFKIYLCWLIKRTNHELVHHDFLKRYKRGPPIHKASNYMSAIVCPVTSILNRTFKPTSSSYYQDN